MNRFDGDAPREPFSAHRRARVVLAAFVLTFLLSRILVLLIMSRRVPDLFLHLGGTHVHHLNYGIFLLSLVAGWALFVPLHGKALRLALLAYGVGLGLTFDEFGMWLHLGGGDWQRASFDAVVVIAALLGLVACAPALNRVTARHWAVLAVVVASLMLFVALLIERLNRFGASMGPRLERLEESGPK
jgi:hypothetical protein